MENFNMLVLHTIMWRRTWCHKRRNMWVYQINIKRPEFGIFLPLIPEYARGWREISWLF